MNDDQQAVQLTYVADPMCSWCWGFHPQLQQVQAKLEGASIDYVMGGLAPDSSAPMPAEMREYVQSAWRAVTERTGARFNWDFWTDCEPRRSTYPACRAVLAAARQDEKARVAMFERIQRAYYLEARNPSIDDTLVELSRDLGLDADRFALELGSEEVKRELRQEIERCAHLGARSFPSLYLRRGDESRLIAQGYATADEVLGQVRAAT